MFAPMGDDDDDFDDDAPERGNGERIMVAVAIAGLSAVVVKLAEWGVEKIRERIEGKKDDSQ